MDFGLNWFKALWEFGVRIERDVLVIVCWPILHQSYVQGESNARHKFSQHFSWLKKKKKFSCHVSNNYNKVTNWPTCYISKFRLKTQCKFLLNNNSDNNNKIFFFFLETNTHMRERTWGSKFDLKAYHKLYWKAMKT